jgi:tetratricopeptide (TPR) repeat protein
LAALYAGICYYQLGQYEDAAVYLAKFSANDLSVEPAALQLLGDAYVQLEEYGKAAKAFEAAAKSGNDLIAPMSLKKAGFVYLEMGNKVAAKKAFETIKADYPASVEAQDIEKYIAIAE